MGADRATLLEFAFDIGAAVDLDEFRAVVTAGIGKLVECDLASYTEVELERPRVLALVDRPVPDIDEILPALEQFAYQHPLITRATGHAETISDYLSARQFARLELYNDVYRRLGAQDQIAINLPAGPGRAIGIALNRTRPSFTIQDRATLDALRPTLARGYCSALAREQARTALEQLDRQGDGPAIASFDRSGRLQYASDRAFALLRAHSGPDRSGLMASCRRVIERADPFPVTIGSDSGALDLTASRVAVGDSIVVELRERSGGSPISSLTARERQLLDHLAAGDRNEQLADALGISRHTVQNHLQSIYRKLGVNTRTAAVAVLNKAR